MERVIGESECVKKPNPLAWLNAFDKLVTHTKRNVSLNEASSIAMANGWSKGLYICISLI